MKTLYFECSMGAAGDMLTAALLELLGDSEGFIRQLNAIGLPGVSVTAEPSVKLGVTGTHVSVKVNGIEEDDEHTHHHHGMHDIESIIEALRVSDKVKKDALAVYQLIAEAESLAHGVPVREIHFHEVGQLDAVTDIIGVCLLLESLAPEQILASAVHVGSGHVRCAHGVLPVPAPATAHICKGIPIYGGSVKGELCTPTGAALLKHFVNRFDTMPVMTVTGIGYGMGKKDFENVNCVRAFMGETAENGGEVVELTCNLDDMTPEAVAFAQQYLLDAGALDVYTIPAGMKKGRAGILFTCVCRRGAVDEMVSLIFKHTTTLGLRENICRRYTLSRKQNEILTAYGSVRVKTAEGYGVTRSKPEYEDVAKIARENDLSIAEVLSNCKDCCTRLQ